MNAVERFFQDLFEIHSSGGGVAETSYYGAIENLLNTAGHDLKPRVRCILSLRNRGEGIPDGGLYTASQFERGTEGRLLEGQLPSRGAIEVKPPSENLDEIVHGEQVARYLARYGLVLVTNLRQFVLVGRGRDGGLAELERYTLFETDEGLWSLAAAPRKASFSHKVRLIEFLKRSLLHAAQLTRPEDVAWFLASHARDARVIVEWQPIPVLQVVREALETTLGLRFVGEKGDHFFKSTLVQTLFYGLFSSWVIWSKQERPAGRGRFDWQKAQWSLRVPMIRALFERIAMPSQLESLGLVETLERAAAVLDRVDRGAFFAAFQEGQAVQYFYEPFLAAFDPDLRKELGVWYTPREIVQFQVARIDTVLREELGIEAGLADPRVDVLDPCCGTGTYLVEVLKCIHRTLSEGGTGALRADELRKAASVSSSK